VKLSEKQLVLWGERIGREVSRSVFLGLTGPLGAGKSVFARAVARGAGVECAVPSPTFNLMFRYLIPDSAPVVHADLFRLQDPSELEEIGWYEVVTEEAIVLAEWPERAGAALPADRWEVALSIPRNDPDNRVVKVIRFGNPPHLPGFPVSVS